ncbi:polymer-forming cytoskeletal protein [Candidatus Zixiibacteriota bacterium]
MKWMIAHLVLLMFLLPCGAPVFGQAGPDEPDDAPAADSVKTQPVPAETPAPTTRKYYLESDTLEDDEYIKTPRDRTEQERKLMEVLRGKTSLEELEELPALEKLDAAEMQEALEAAQEHLQDLHIAAPRVPGAPDAGMDIILPDTVYTTEITIGPNGIEFYDTTGEATVILGRPTGLDVPFVFTEDGGRLLTTKHSADIIQIGTDVVIGEDERVEGNVVVFGGNIEVEGEVKGDVVAILGDVSVSGYVHGSAIAVTGEVVVHSMGKVRKDVIGGSITTHPGSLIGGKKEYTSVRIPVRPQLFRGVYLAILLTHVGLAVFIIFLTLLAHAFGGKNIAMIRTKISEGGFKAFLVGLLSLFLGLPLVFVLLIITVIGIPVALLVLPLAVVLAKILGYAAVGLSFGSKLAENTIFKVKSQLGQTIMGTSAMLIIILFGGVLVTIPATPVKVLGWILFGIGHAISFIAITTGVGAVVLTRFGTRLHKNKKPQAAPVAKPLPPGSIQPGPSAA